MINDKYKAERLLTKPYCFAVCINFLKSNFLKKTNHFLWIMGNPENMPYKMCYSKFFNCAVIFPGAGFREDFTTFCTTGKYENNFKWLHTSLS